MGCCNSKNVSNDKKLQKPICAYNASLTIPTESPSSRHNLQQPIIQSPIEIYRPSIDVVFIILSQDLEEARELQNDLSNLAITIHVCDDVAQCNNRLSAIENQDVFMVIMAPWDDTFFIICNDTQISRGYFLSNNSSSSTEYKMDPLIKHASKCVHFSNRKEFISQIAHDVRVWETLKLPIHFINEHRLEDSSPSNFWYSLLTQILLRTPSDSTLSREEMFTFLRAWYKNLPNQIQNITDMERDYTSDRAIHYYTYSSFVYPCINRILRSGNIDLIFKLRRFIKDLDSQLRELHRTYIAKMSRSITVYRGQHMTEDDFTNFTRRVGTYISFNNFLSTSLDRNVALMFAEAASFNIQTRQEFSDTQKNAGDVKHTSNRVDMRDKPKVQLQTAISREINPNSRVGVLMEIIVDPKVKTQACFADISDVSAFGDAEREVLFSMNSVFRIDEILELEETAHIKHVKLSLANDRDLFPLEDLGDYIRNQWGRNTDTITLGDCLADRGDYDRAAYYYAQPLDMPLAEYDRGILYNNLGWLYECKEMYDLALNNYEKALFIQQKQIDEYPLDLASTYNNVGIIYFQKEDLRAALSNFEKALKIKRSIQVPLDISSTASIAITSSNIGLVEHKNGNFAKAFDYYNEAYQKLTQILPDSHPNLVTLLSNMGTVDMDLDRLEDALKAFEKVLKMRKGLLPEKHPDIAWSHIKIGRVYEKQNNYFDAKMNYDIALEIQHCSLSRNHSDIAVTLNRLGSVEHLRGRCDNSLNFFKKALDIYEHTQSNKTTDIAMLHNNFGLAYARLGLYDKAQTSCETSLQLLLKTLRPNHPSLAKIYGNLARIYDHQKDFKRAYDCEKRAIDIGLQALPANHEDLRMYQLHADFLEGKIPKSLEPIPPASTSHPRVRDIRFFRKWKISFSRTN